MSDEYIYQTALEETDRWVRDRVTYRRDPAVAVVGEKLIRFGDQWSTAGEIITRGYGDCEDFAIVASTRLVDYHQISKDQLVFILASTDAGVLNWNHALVSCKTDNIRGMMTCADTNDDRVSLLTEKYWDPFGGPMLCRKWASVAEPENWFLWAS